MTDKIALKRDTFGGWPRLTFTDPRGAGHTPSGKRFPPKGSWASAEFVINTATHHPGAGWVSIWLTEGQETAAGNNTSRSVSMTLPQDRARELYAALDEVFGNRTLHGDPIPAADPPVNLLAEMQARGLR